MPERYRANVAVRKTPKSGVSTSGDSVDVVERPRGGLSVVIADAQGSGPAAKRVSNMVVARVTSLIGEGARDGAVARAVHDSLYAFRGGKIVCTLTILSIDLYTETFVVSRNGNAGAILYDGEDVMCLDEEIPPIGVHHFTKPAIMERELIRGTRAAAFTDGMISAGKKRGAPMGYEGLADILKDGNKKANSVADDMFGAALNASSGLSSDDMSLAVITVENEEAKLGEAAIRTIDLSFPF